MPAVPFSVMAARLTPVGRGAIATIRVEASSVDVTAHWLNGLDPLFRAANAKRLADQPLDRIVFGRWGRQNAEELVVCRVQSHVMEIYCHGGNAAVRRVLDDLKSVDCEIVDWSQQTRLSTDLLEAECLEVLSRTSTWRTSRIALQQTNGLLRSVYTRLSHSGSLRDSSIDLELDELLSWSTFGIHLSTPWNVVLTGRPNVGKSSLINRLLGYNRAIVFDQPGTTRDVVTGETAFDGWPVLLADTAGIRDNAGSLEAAGIALARDRLRSADLVVVVLDLSQPPSTEDFSFLAEQPIALVVGHKSDLPDQWSDRLPPRAIRVSSVTGEGVAELQKRLVEKLIPELPDAQTAVPMTQRQIELLQQARAATTVDSRQRALNELIGPVPANSLS